MELVQFIQENTDRYLKIFYEAVDEIIKTKMSDAVIDPEKRDVLDNLQGGVAPADGNGGGGGSGDDSKVPVELYRRYQICLKSSSKTQTTSIREVKSSNIGTLVTIKALVTKVSDVKPLIEVATYTCDSCGYEQHQPIKTKSYVPRSECER